MNAILDFIKETIGKSLAIVIIKLCDAIKNVSQIFIICHNAKEKKEEIQQQKEKENKIDDVANNGTIDDLLDLGKNKSL